MSHKITFLNIRQAARERGYFLRFRRARGYVFNAIRSRQAHGSKPSWFQLVWSFVPWLKSFNSGEELSENASPWVTFPAVRFLKRKLRPEWRVFEFGGGASTLFFALRCHVVYTIEHDDGWANRIQSSLVALGISNCQLRQVPGESRQFSRRETDFALYGSKCNEWQGYTFEGYAKSIEDHADQSLDLVLIDGRARDACMWHAMKKVKPGGLLILDNSERERYEGAMRAVPATWLRLDFPGPSARANFFSKTTIWVVPPRS
jgi:hypothetical protein